MEFQIHGTTFHKQMPTFSYRVRDHKGKAIAGFMQGETEQAVSEALGKQRYFPMSIVESKPIKFKL